jgi:expansin (peptidoglycan-binding protein)
MPKITAGAFDLSPDAFQKLAPLSVGRTKMSWDASSLVRSLLPLRAPT